MGSQVTVSEHLVLFATTGWGHLRPLCAFSAKVVKQRPDVSITYLMVGGSRKKIEREISRYFSENGVDFGAAGNVRIVNICADLKLTMVTVLPFMSQTFRSYYEDLVNGKPVQCLETNTTFNPLRRPSSIILDRFLFPILQQIRSVTRKSIPVLAWVTAYGFSGLRIMGPEKFGGYGDVATKARAQAETTGRKFEEVIDGLYRSQEGRTTKVPGLPPMYDYEWFPQERTSEVRQSDIYMAAYAFARECDGFISVSSAAYEAESLAALRSWLAETDRPLYTIGPLVPPGFGDAAGLSSVAKLMEFESSKNADDIQRFLDKILKSHGKYSLIYVSFGSHWWPKRNEHVWVLVDVLLELGFPFILSHASPRAIIPPGYSEKIKQSGIGLLSTWSPQQAILNHPVTGWFLTHCGQNSVTEALSQGIPMIGWPLEADQPANAAHLTLNLDVAFEMIEVRTGVGLKPLYRGVQPTGTIEAVTAEARSVLKRARGPEGERKRLNAQSIRYKWKNEWKEGGEALNNLRKFLTDYCSGDY